MAEVMNAQVDNLDRRRGDRTKNNNIKEAANTSKSPDGGGSSPAPPPHPPRPQATGGRDRERDSRERRDDREFDRRGRNYYDRNRSPPPPPPRERDYNKRGRPSPSPPPPPYRDRRGGGHSPTARRSPPFPPYKRLRRDDYDGRRGSPSGGYGPGDRRFYDYQGGYNREMGGRHSYPDERPHGRFFGRLSGGNQGCPF